MNYKDLKRPVTNKKQPETTHNKEDTIYRPEPTYNESKKMQNNRQQADFQIILQNGANSSLL